MCGAGVLGVLGCGGSEVTPAHVLPNCRSHHAETIPRNHFKAAIGVTARLSQLQNGRSAFTLLLVKLIVKYCVRQTKESGNMEMDAGKMVTE